MAGGLVPDDTVSYPCTTCNAAPNRDCITSGGLPAPHYHEARLRLARGVDLTPIVPPGVSS